jgi:hypothetical protein
MHVVTGHSDTTRSIVRAIERLAAAGHLETRTQRVDATWAYGQPGMVSLTLIMSQEEIEDAREAPAMVAVPPVGATRAEEPRVSHAPNICAAFDPARGCCDAPIAWAPGTAGTAAGRGWYHLDPEITDHEAVPGA